MRALSDKIDAATEPSPDDIAELAETRARQLLAFDELKSINLTGKPIGKHPLAVHQDNMQELRELRTKWPERFMKEYYLVERNVKRYTQQLNNATDDADKVRVEKLLQKHQARRLAFLEIMKEIE